MLLNGFFENVLYAWASSLKSTFSSTLNSSTVEESAGSAYSVDTFLRFLSCNKAHGILTLPTTWHAIQSTYFIVDSVVTGSTFVLHVVNL